MNDETERAIAVGSSHRTWWFVLLVASSVILVIGGSLLLGARAKPAVPMLVAGGVGGLASLLAGAVLSMGKASVRVVPQGFVFQDRHGERTLALDQVICASLYSTSNYTNGELK